MDIISCVKQKDAGVLQRGVTRASGSSPLPLIVGHRLHQVEPLAHAVDAEHALLEDRLPWMEARRDHDLLRRQSILTAPRLGRGPVEDEVTIRGPSTLKRVHVHAQPRLDLDLRIPGKAVLCRIPVVAPVLDRAELPAPLLHATAHGLEHPALTHERLAVIGALVGHPVVRRLLAAQDQEAVTIPPLALHEHPAERVPELLCRKPVEHAAEQSAGELALREIEQDLRDLGGLARPLHLFREALDPLHHVLGARGELDRFTQERLLVGAARLSQNRVCERRADRSELLLVLLLDVRPHVRGLLRIHEAGRVLDPVAEHGRDPQPVVRGLVRREHGRLEEHVLELAQGLEHLPAGVRPCPGQEPSRQVRLSDELVHERLGSSRIPRSRERWPAPAGAVSELAQDALEHHPTLLLGQVLQEPGASGQLEAEAKAEHPVAHELADEDLAVEPFHGLEPLLASPGLAQPPQNRRTRNPELRAPLAQALDDVPVVPARELHAHGVGHLFPSRLDRAPILLVRARVSILCPRAEEVLRRELLLREQILELLNEPVSTPVHGEPPLYQSHLPRYFRTNACERLVKLAQNRGFVNPKKGIEGTLKTPFGRFCF